MSTTRPAHPTQVALPGQTHVADGPHDHLGMYVMHHAFRRDLARFAASVAVTPVGDDGTWDALRQRWTRFTRVLHEHHTAEDRHYWPVLLTATERSGSPADLEEVRAMSAEHEGIDPALGALTDAFAAMVGHPCDDHRHALEIRLAGLREVLGDHLRHEESTVLPLVQRVMTAEEFAKVEKDVERAYRPQDVPFVIGWAVDDLPVDARRRLLASAGPVYPILLALVRRRYERGERRAFRYGGLVGAV